MNKCLKCGKETVNNKFCSKICSNRYNTKSRVKRNKYGAAKPPVECPKCNNILPYSSFSYIDKLEPSKGKREICQKCSKALVEKERRERTWKYRAKKIMIDNAKSRARRTGIEFDITEDDFEIPDICPVLKIKLKRTSKNDFTTSPSIDRIDNTKGYTKDNIMIISRRANILKKDATLEELIMIGEFYADIYSRQRP